MTDKVYVKLEEYLSLRSNAAEREVRIIEEIIKRLSRLNELETVQNQSNDHHEGDVNVPSERPRSSLNQSVSINKPEAEQILQWWGLSDSVHGQELAKKLEDFVAPVQSLTQEENE